VSPPESCPLPAPSRPRRAARSQSPRPAAPPPPAPPRRSPPAAPAPTRRSARQCPRPRWRSLRAPLSNTTRHHCAHTSRGAIMPADLLKETHRMPSRASGRVVRRCATPLLVLLFGCVALFAQGRGRGAIGPQGHPFDPSETDAPPVVTHHQIQIGGQTLSYTATAGRMLVSDPAGKPEAHIFFVAYTLDGEKQPNRRPLAFIYNGGPGEPAIWVHMGGFGPRRIVLNPDGSLPAPPYSLVDNQETWLQFTDEVFIDPDGTGYSRAVNAAALRATSGVGGDLQSLGEFIRLYLTKYDRYSSPLFLAGESYGTFRSAGLAGYLTQRGIALNGVVLLSSVIDMHTLAESPDNDQPNVLFLPTYTATAWEHKRLPPDLQKETIEQVVKQSED